MGMDKTKLRRIGNAEIPRWVRWLVFLAFVGLYFLWFSGLFGF